MSDEGAQQGWVGRDPQECGLSPMQKIAEFRRREIREGVHLGVAPDQLHGVEFRGVAGQQMRVYAPAVACEPPAHGSAAMRGQAVPDEINRPALAARELLEEVPDGLAIVIGVGQHAEVTAHPEPSRRDRERADHRDFAERTAALRQDGRLSAPRPAAPHEWRHQEAGFVAEDERRSTAGGVFFIRGHSSLTQRWMAASSRSIARPRGFCGLQPNSCRSRPT